MPLSVTTAEPPNTCDRATSQNDRNYTGPAWEGINFDFTNPQLWQQVCSQSSVQTLLKN